MWLPKKGSAGGNMLLKYTLKNIISKPGRLIIILLCMAAACCAAFVALDLGGSVKEIYRDILGDMGGSSDYIFTYKGSKDDIDELFAGLPESRHLSYRVFAQVENRRDEKQYAYTLTNTLYVYTYSDLETGCNMKIIPREAVFSDGEIAIGKRYSDKYGYKVGDTITLEDIEYNKHLFTVSSVFDETKSMKDLYMAIITQNDYVKLRGELIFNGGYIDVINDDDIDEFKECMKTAHPTVSLINMFLSDDELGDVDQYSKIMYLIFVLVFVLVIFVMVSFTEKIITERMSVIGTLRSIGMSMRKTTFILLFENVIYGAAGGIFGLIAYLIVRKIGLNYLSSISGLNGSDVKITWSLVPVIILFAVLIQVLIPVKEVLKAVKTPIRDIIFDSRDSEYKVSFKKTVAGMVCIALGLILGFLSKNIYVSGTGILFLIVGAAFSIQFIVRKLTLFLAVIFEKRNMPVADRLQLSGRLNSTGSKKPNSGNAVLTVAAAAAAAAIFVVVNSIIVSINKPMYDADIIVTANALKTAKYKYLEEIEEISDMEYIYQSQDTIKTPQDGHQYGFFFLSLPTGGMFRAMGDMPAELGKYDMILDEPAAGKMGLREGDSIEIEFHTIGVFPITKTLTVRGITKETYFGSTGGAILSCDLYKELFDNIPSLILMRSDDPAAAIKAVEPTFASGENVQSLAESIKETKKQSRKIVVILISIMAAAVVMTLIGISGNQLIGFAARKKEYAMLHSCACSQSKIIQMILTENALLFGTSCIMAGIICIPVSILISKILRQTNLGIFIDVRYGMLTLCIVILWMITMLTSLSPINSLKKMNTAMELKYE